VLSVNPEAVLERIRALCLAMPESSERVSHGIPAFDVAGRMFAYFRHDHHCDGRTVVCVKTAGRDEQEMLIEADPDLYSWPAYIGPSGWISLDLAREDTDWGHVRERLRTSYRLAAPRRLSGGGLKPGR
jgi:phosphoribosylglycinamide formyltransferase-1/phosphoribosylamine--glycine ligase/phosphoribosylglycinamide formyltransferase/phosphoribosylformylglycinamidine cyclo-ligase